MPPVPKNSCKYHIMGLTDTGDLTRFTSPKLTCPGKTSRARSCIWQDSRPRPKHAGAFPNTLMAEHSNETDMQQKTNGVSISLDSFAREPMTCFDYEHQTPHSRGLHVQDTKDAFLLTSLNLVSVGGVSLDIQQQQPPLTSLPPSSNSGQCHAQYKNDFQSNDLPSP